MLFFNFMVLWLLIVALIVVVRTLAADRHERERRAEDSSLVVVWGRASEDIRAGRPVHQDQLTGDWSATPMHLSYRCRLEPMQMDSDSL